MGELTFTTLEGVERWGVPIDLDGTPLTLMQARVLASIVEKTMDEAGHPKGTAVKLSVAAFRAMYEKTDDGWKARRMAKLSNGLEVRNKFHKADQRERIMARTRYVEPQEQQKPAVWVPLLEAGARHGKADKGRIFDAIRGLFSALNKDDQDGLFRDIRKKHGLKLRVRNSGQPVDAGKGGKEALPQPEGAKA